MLTEITLENFKCFQEATTFPLSKINLLTGINGRGKSTLLQSLLLMKQSVENDEDLEEITLNGNSIEIGAVNDVKNKKKTIEAPIIFNFIFQDNFFEIHLKSIDLESNFLKVDSIKYIKKNRENLMNEKLSNSSLNKIISKNIIKEVSILLSDTLKDDIEEEERKQNIAFFHNINYISADRLPPQKYYNKMGLSQIILDKIGENIGDILFQWGGLEVNENLCIGGNAGILSHQADAWLSKIFDSNIGIIIDDTPSPYIIPIYFAIEDDMFTPPNVGFGYSHVLPIIVAGLIAEAGEILIIENPEAHLHPKAQSELTKFLAKVASCGVQVFIESHSDHILNGLRIAVKNQILAPEDTKVLYFSKDKETNENKIYYPQIDADGRIDKWQEGFFDEWDNSLLELA